MWVSLASCSSCLCHISPCDPQHICLILGFKGYLSRPTCQQGTLEPGNATANMTAGSGVPLPGLQTWLHHLLVTLNKLLDLSKSHFPHQKIEITVLTTQLVKGLNKIILGNSARQRLNVHTLAFIIILFIYGFQSLLFLPVIYTRAF